MKAAADTNGLHWFHVYMFMLNALFVANHFPCFLYQMFIHLQFIFINQRTNKHQKHKQLWN